MIFCFAIVMGMIMVLFCVTDTPVTSTTISATENDQFWTLQQKYEHNMEKTLTRLLEPLVGKGKVRVAVQVELDLKNAKVNRRSETQDLPQDQSNTRTNFITESNEKQIQNLIKKQHIGIAVDGTTSNENIYQPRLQKEMETYWKLVKSTVGYNALRGDTLEIQNVPFSSPATVVKFPTKTALILAAFLIMAVFFLILCTWHENEKQPSNKAKNTGFSSEKFNKILQHPERAVHVFKNWIYLPLIPKDTDWTPVQKVSIVLLTTSEDFVRQILIALNDDEVRKVSKAMASLGVIPPQESSRILNELYEAMFVASTVVGNPIRAQQILNESTRVSDIVENSNWQSTHPSLWQDLENISPLNLSQKLTDLPPEITAYILYQLPSKKSAEILPYFAPQKTNQVLIHLSHIGQVRVETNKRLEKEALASVQKILNLLHTPTGAEKTSEILSQLKNTSSGEKILNNLAHQEPSLAKKLSAQFIRFDDLPKWSTSTIRTLLKNTPRSIVLIALIGASKEILQQIQTNIPAQIWQDLNREMTAKEKQTPPEQIAQARQRIVEIARTLLQQNKITI